MRVTNSMLTNNLLRNLHANFRRTNDIQNMMASGRRFAHISDNPTAMLQAQTARNKIARLSHFQRTTETAQGWLYQAETSMGDLQYVLVNIYEELVKAADDGKTESDRHNIAQVIGQMRNHFVDTLNSTFGNNFVFSGFNTPGDSAANIADTSIRPFVVINNELHFNGFNLSQFDGMPAQFLSVNLDFSRQPGETSDADVMTRLRGQLEAIQLGTPGPPPVPGRPIPATIGSTLDPVTGTNDQLNTLIMFHRLKSDVLTFDVGPGIEMPVTMNGIDLVMSVTACPDTGDPIARNTFNVLHDIYVATTSSAAGGVPLSADELSALIRPLQSGQNHLLARIAEVGGRYRRIELLQARFDQDRINNRQMMSNAEDVDMGEVIMDLRMAEAVMQASMAAGARVIQPSLMDFLR